MGLFNNPGYRLVVTGHSLGAGVACLWNILVQAESLETIGSDPLLSKQLEIQCFGFACPPVFFVPASAIATDNQAPIDNGSNDSLHCDDFGLQQSLDRAICFITESDVIPFLSIDSVRRFASVLAAVDKYTETLNPLEQVVVAWGEGKLPLHIVQAIHDGSQDLEILPRAERLQIPARTVVRVFDGDTPATFHDPALLANRSILLSSGNADFLLDHVPPRYEVSMLRQYQQSQL